jgi:hypothetical protein
MSGTLLSIVQKAMARTGFRKPSSVAGNASDETQTLLALANEAGELIADAFPWQYLQTEGSITLVTSDQDYALPTDFLFMTAQSMWNRTAQRPVTISLTSTEWQYYKGWLAVAGLNLRARVQGDEIVIEQTITAAENGEQIFFEYRSKNWLTNSGGTGKAAFTLDTDICLHDEGLMVTCLKYLIKEQRGLDWQSDYMKYQQKLRTHASNNRVARVIRLSGQRTPTLGVTVPDGNFGV